MPRQGCRSLHSHHLFCASNAQDKEAMHLHLDVFAEFAVKKYSSHRGITSKDLSDAKEAKKVHDAKFFKKGKTLAT